MSFIPQTSRRAFYKFYISHVNTRTAEGRIMSGMLSHFSWLEVGFAVQRAHSPPLLRLVISQLHFGLFSPVGGAVAGLQVGLIIRGLVLRFGSDEFHRFHICVRFKLRPGKKKQCRK